MFDSMFIKVLEGWERVFLAIWESVRYPVRWGDLPLPLGEFP